MKDLDVFALQKRLREHAHETGLDITKRSGMANVAGKPYNHIAPNLTLYTTPKGIHGSGLSLYIPHENTHVTALESYAQPGMIPHIMQNLMIPGKETLHTGETVHSLEYPKDNTRIGPHNYDENGLNWYHSQQKGMHVLTPEEEEKFGTIHDLISHVNRLPRPQGWHNNFHQRTPGNVVLSHSDLKDFNLRDALEHQRRRDTHIDMPRGTENMLAINLIHAKDWGTFEPAEEVSHKHYLYDIDSESLKPVEATKAKHW